MVRVLICGGRDFTDYRKFCISLNRIRDEMGGFSEIIHGGAKGADWCAHLYATSALKIPERAFPAEWSKHGRKAGPLRNQKMLDEGKPELVVAFPGGTGTADMVKRSLAAGIEVISIEYGDPSPNV